LNLRARRTLLVNVYVGETFAGNLTFYARIKKQIALYIQIKIRFNQLMGSVLCAFPAVLG
jgi:hypothetical protein